MFFSDLITCYFHNVRSIRITVDRSSVSWARVLTDFFNTGWMASGVISLNGTRTKFLLSILWWGIFKFGEDITKSSAKRMSISIFLGPLGKVFLRPIRHSMCFKILKSFWGPNGHSISITMLKKKDCSRISRGSVSYREDVLLIPMFSFSIESNAARMFFFLSAWLLPRHKW